MVTEKDNELLGAPSKSDGLGIQDIWAERGKDLVPHLTGSTHFIQGFQILVEIYRLWEIFAESEGYQIPPKDFDKFFILIEQTFARTVAFCNGEWNLPGSKRVKARKSDPNISLDPEWHLLNGQKSNGLYGLYRGASARAGLLESNRSQLSEKTMEEAQDKTKIRGNSQTQLLSLVKKALAGELVPISGNQNKELRNNIFETYVNPPLVHHFETMLIKKPDLTNRLVEGLKKYGDIEYRQFLTKLATDFKSENLPNHAKTIYNVIACENFLAVVVFLFDWLCSKRGKKIEEIAGFLPWNFHVELSPVFEKFKHSGEYNDTAKVNWSLFVDNLISTSNLALLRSIIEIHSLISVRRKRSPWVWIDEKGYLVSEMIDTSSEIEIPQIGVAWYHDYYLVALRNIARQIEGV